MLVERGIGTSRSKECVVWSIVYLSDGTIISGDSSGRVKIWDGHTGTLIKSHQVTNWDVLTLSVSQVRNTQRHIDVAKILYYYG